MRKHYFIDVELTLAPFTDESQEALFRLAKTGDVVLISSKDYKQMKEALPFLPGKFFVLSQAGNFASRGWKRLWRRRLNRVHKSVASEHIRVLKSIADRPPVDPDTIVQDLGGVILYSLPGHGAMEEVKATYDIGYKERGRILDLYPLTSSVCNVRVSGNDSLVYTAIGMDVEDNIRMLCEREKWEEKHCVYIITPSQLIYESSKL